MEVKRAGAEATKGLWLALLSCLFLVTACAELGDRPKGEETEESGFQLLKNDVTRLGERTKREGPEGHLARAQELTARREYDAALQENKLALASSPNRSPADKALFNMVVIYSHPGNPKKDPAQAAGLLRQLQKDFPYSPWTEQAKVWLETNKETERFRRDVLQENDKLKKAIAEATHENDKLKKAIAEAQQENQKLKHIVEQSRIVDIEIDEKKRSRGR